MQPLPVEYPVTFSFDAPETIARWRPLVAWLLVIPQAIVAGVISWVAGICAFAAWVIVLVTGKLPDGLAGVLTLAMRYQARVAVYAMFLKEEYPPFAFDTVTADPGDDSRVRVDAAVDMDDRNRLTVFFRAVLVLPHLLMLAFLAIAVSFVVFIAWFVVLFTGKWPEGMRHFVLGYVRWNTRVMGYYYLLTDEWPPVALD